MKRQIIAHFWFNDEMRKMEKSRNGVLWNIMLPLMLITCLKVKNSNISDSI
jgi:hypothetical protein